MMTMDDYILKKRQAEGIDKAIAAGQTGAVLLSLLEVLKPTPPAPAPKTVSNAVIRDEVGKKLDNIVSLATKVGERKFRREDLLDAQDRVGDPSRRPTRFPNTSYDPDRNTDAETAADVDDGDELNRELDRETKELLKGGWELVAENKSARVFENAETGERLALEHKRGEVTRILHLLEDGRVYEMSER